MVLGSQRRSALARMIFSCLASIFLCYVTIRPVMAAPNGGHNSGLAIAHQAKQSVAAAAHITEHSGADVAPVRNSDWFSRFHVAEWLQLLFNGLLAIFTYFLWKATAGLWEAAKEQATDLKRSLDIAERSALAAQKAALVAERALAITQRPQMSLQRFNTVARHSSPLGRVVSFYVSAEWRNNGATFAKDCACEMQYKVIDPAELSNCKFSHDNSDVAAGNVAPRTGVTAMGVEIPIAELVEVYTDRKAILIWALFEYRDSFEDEYASPTHAHHTECCVRLEIKADPTDVPDGVEVPVSYRTHIAHNSAT